MSKYAETATTVRSQAYLVAALNELGLRRRSTRTGPPWSDMRGGNGRNART